MVPFLYTAREHHAVATPEQYLARHAAAIAKKRRAGMRFAVHESTAPRDAYIDGNSWLIRCQCGNGCATDPAWRLACCFGCGAVHRVITFPADPAGVEAALLERDNPQARRWSPGHSVDQVKADTEALRDHARQQERKATR